MSSSSPQARNHHFRAEVPAHLLDTQVPVVRAFLHHFARIALDAVDPRGRASGTEDDVRRPDNVFCIDGGRGAGKTFTLLSIEKCLDELSRWRKGAESKWADFFEENLGTLAQQLQQSANSSISIAHVLRIIFPVDMEREESLMESIFAAMVERTNDTSHPEEDKQTLQDDLRMNVAEGWYFAKRFGQEAIIRDSIDYKDFVSRYEKESRQAANRIASWRNFIDKYLRFHGAATLVVLVDDSDVRPELAQDILHSIRMFLNHPRVCTALAGNIRSMRTSLLHLSMQRVGQSARALDRQNYQTAQDWRRMERRSIEDYLEKVLPPAQRFFLRSPRLNEKSDFKKIAGKELHEVIQNRLQDTREKFLKAKFTLALDRELRGQDHPSTKQQRDIEEFLSWWVFANRYAASLAPRSARQIGTFARYFADRNDVIISKNQRRKRLPVALHDVPDNYTLVQRLGDEDVNIASWLRQQDLQSVWVGQRKFTINGRDTNQGSYTYEYIQYRIDVGLAMPLRDNVEEAIPLGLLPHLYGRRSLRRFFQPRNMSKQQRRYGVSRRIEHAALPGNCVYFSDLSALPDISISSAEDKWMSPSKPGLWEASLAGRWLELIDDEQDDYLVRYFTDVVCRALRDTDEITNASLTLQLDPSDIDLVSIPGLYEFSAHAEVSLFRDLPSGFFLAGQDSEKDKRRAYVNWQIMTSARRELSKLERQEGEANDRSINAAKRLIALYAALVNDLRRAWHAIRIHEKAPLWMESEQAVATSQEYERASRAWIDSQSKMPLYTCKMLKDLLSKSAWIGNLFQVFQPENLIAGIDRAIPDKDGKNRQQDREKLKKSFEVPFRLCEIDNAKSGEEDIDYGVWADSLRAIGRSFRKDYPVYGRRDEYLKEIELEPNLPSKVLKNWALDISKPEATEIQKQYAREARNFVFLMNGLAPSLPAIIHTNVMSRVYEAELIRTLSDAQRGHEMAAAEYLTEHPEQSPSERIKKYYDQALDFIEQWSELVGVLTISVRYINIKSRHLFAKLFLVEAGGDGKAIDGPLVDRQMNFLELCGLRAEKTEAHEAFKWLQTTFDLSIARELAMMPDVAPATLFGEGWFADLVKAGTIRKTLSAQGLTDLQNAPPLRNDPRNIHGMFGEIEQWLWATSRCLRKLRAVVLDEQRRAQSKVLTRTT
jgi:hypothetical protein